MNERKVLHSWKAIASYMGLGVRTVQRYEQHLGLPVRRFGGIARSSVSAFTDELDRWKQTSGTHPITRAEWEQAMNEIEQLRIEVASLRKITEELNKNVNSNAINGRSRKPKTKNGSLQLSSAS